MFTFEQTYALAPGGRIEIEQRSGHVRIRGWDEPGVQLRAVGGDVPIEERLRVESSARTLQIEVLSATRWFSIGRGSGLDLELMVPTGTRIDLQTGSGDVVVEQTAGPVTVEAGSGNLTLTGTLAVTVTTGSGDIHIHQANGTVHLEAGSGNAVLNEIRGAAEVELGSGDVTMRAVAGNVTLETGSGNITLHQVTGQIELESGSGDIHVAQASGPSLSIETGGGNVMLQQLDVRMAEVESSHGDIRLELAAVYPGGKYWVESGSGNVTVAVPPEANLSVGVESSSGHIRHSGLPLRVLRLEKGELQAVLGQGGAQLSVDSSAGDVVLCPYTGPAASPLLKAVQQDKALENSEQLQRVLKMVEEGKLSPEEAEQLLSALDEEEVSSS